MPGVSAGSSVPVGHGAIGNEMLDAVDDKIIPDAAVGGAHSRDIRASSRFGGTKGGKGELVGEHPQILLPLLFATRFQQRHSGKPVSSQSVGDSRAAVIQLFENQDRIQDPKAGPAVFLRDLEVHQAEVSVSSQCEAMGMISSAANLRASSFISRCSGVISNENIRLSLRNRAGSETQGTKAANV